MTHKIDEKLAGQILRTFKICNTKLDKEDRMIAVTMLTAYPAPAVRAALNRCVLEVKHALTIAHVVERIDDGRPSLEQAWKMLPKRESESAMMTTEMQAAFGVCCDLLAVGDFLGARLAFKSEYEKLVATNKARGTAVNWTLSMGTDKAQRNEVIKNAVRKGLMPSERAMEIAGDIWGDDCPKKILTGNQQREIKELVGKIGDLEDEN